MCTRIEHHLPRGQVLRAGLAFYLGPSQVFSTSTSHLSSGPSFPCNVSSPLHLLDLSHFSRSGSGISWTILAAYLSGRTGPQRPHAGSGGHSQAAGNQRRVLARRYHNPKAAAKILWQPPGHLATWRGGGKAGQHPTMLVYLTPHIPRPSWKPWKPLSSGTTARSVTRAHGVSQGRMELPFFPLWPVGLTAECGEEVVSDQR